MDLSRIKYIPIIDKETGIVIAKRPIKSIAYIASLNKYIINDSIVKDLVDVLHLETLNSDTNLPIMEF